MRDPWRVLLERCGSDVMWLRVFDRARGADSYSDFGVSVVMGATMWSTPEVLEETMIRVGGHMLSDDRKIVRMVRRALVATFGEAWRRGIP